MPPESRPEISEADMVPLGDDFLIRPYDSNASDEDLEVVHRWQYPRLGTVIAVGPGRVLDNGTTCPVPVSPGDVVALTVYGGTTLLFNGQHYIHASECDVLFVVHKERS